MDEQKWLKLFNDNYYGRTPQAKELQDYVKSAFTGGSYIPWAVMYRLLKQQDPKFSYHIHENENGGTVFWEHGENVTVEPNLDGGEPNTTSVQWNNYFVKVSATFGGVTETEYYPIQGQLGKKVYGAPKIIDQNMVNKAIQRAKAKIGSAVSGLALGLYENGELQFKDDEEETPVKPKITKDTVKSEQKTPVVKQSHVSYANYMIEHKNDLKDIIKKTNIQVVKGYGFSFDLDETKEEIAEKLGKVKDGKIFFKALLNQTGMTKEEIKKVVE